MSTWHYLPVLTEREGSVEYTLCEVYLDDEGCVESWTMNHSIAASGETPNQLRADLEFMLNDLARWKPVRFAELTVGMRIHPSNPKIRG